MTMKAKIRTDSMGNLTVHMEGGLDYENGIPLEEELITIMSENPASQITLDLNRLDFVGSSGIGFFVNTIKRLNDKKDQIRLVNVKNEFIKVFQLFDGNFLDIIVNEFDDDETANLSTRFSGKRRTFQN